MITKEQIFKALCHGWPNSPCSLSNDYTDFDKDIIWHDENSLKPTLEEIESYYKKIAYLDERVANYPSLQEQFDTLYHYGFDEWKNRIRRLKLNFPNYYKRIN